MYSYIFESNANFTGMTYGRIESRPSGIATYESLGTTFAVTHTKTPAQGLVAPNGFSPDERHMMYHLQGESLITPNEVVDLATLVRDATEAWRGLLQNADVTRVWTDLGEVTREVVNKSPAGLFLPLNDGQPPMEFERYRANEDEINSIHQIEHNITAMSTDRSVPTPGDYL